MSIYSYENTKQFTTYAGGLRFLSGETKSFNSTQPDLDNEVPSVLRRYVDGILDNNPADEIPGTQTPTTTCRACFPMVQAPGSGNPIDASGNSAQCYILPEYTDAAAWANSGYFTTGSTLGFYAVAPNSVISWDMATDSIMFSTVVNLPNPGANQSFVGCANTTTRYGFYVQAKPGGKCRVFINSTGGYVASLSDSTAVIADGTDHTLTVMIDGPTRSVFLFVDGALSDQWIGAYSGGGVVTGNLSLGTNLDIGTAGTPIACKFRGVQFYKATSAGLPLNAAELARELHRRPLAPLSSTDLLPPAQVWPLSICGQSNEKGAGTRAARVGRLGCPIGDGLQPYGTAGNMSMWPMVSEAAGRAGVWMPILNTARGSSSIAAHWCGQIVTWGSNQRTAFGQYVVAAGNVYKATATSGTAANTNGNTGATAPTWPGSGTVVDNQVTWSYVRAATGADTVGKIMREGDDLFDPNGYVANLVSFNAAVPTAVKRLVYISFDQEDSTRLTTRASYLAALRAVIDYLRVRGYIAIVGVSFYSAPLDAWYLSDLIPATEDALDLYTTDPGVKRGTNLRNELGALPTAPTRGTLGLQADGLHATDETIVAASRLVAARVLA